MSTGPEDDDSGDIDPGDLEDLGELGDGDQEDDDSDDGDQGATKLPPIPDADGWAKVQRKLRRQEERISRLVGTKGGKTPARKLVASDADAQLLAQIRGQKPGKLADQDDDDDEQAAETARWKGIAVQNAAASQIAAAGFTGTAKQAARLARLIDTADLEPNRDGSFDLEDEIDELKEEYPQLFQQPGESRRVPRVSRRQQTDTPKPDANRNTSNALLKSAGYR